jgi:hypothetical protein
MVRVLSITKLQSIWREEFGLDNFRRDTHEA